MAKYTITQNYGQLNGEAQGPS